MAIPPSHLIVTGCFACMDYCKLEHLPSLILQKIILFLNAECIIRLSQTCSLLREVVGHYCFLLLDQEDMETIENWKKSGRKLVQLSLVIKGQGSKERIDKAICKMVSILEEIDLVNVVKLNIDIHGS